MITVPIGERLDKIILGIGNPGVQYRKTRHNIGFRVVDYIAQSFRTSFQPSSLKALAAEIRMSGNLFLLLKPLTYVNLSGECAQAALAKYHLPISSLLVITDDLHLPLGQMRIRRKGSDGGHRGLASIIANLGSVEIPRVRIGIDECATEDKASYVLSEFSSEEEKIITNMLPVAYKAAISWIEQDIDFVMNEYSRSAQNKFFLRE